MRLISSDEEVGRVGKRQVEACQLTVPLTKYDECVEVRAAAVYAGREGTALEGYAVDDMGVLECFALADQWCLEDLKTALLRYIDHTWSLENAVDR